MIFENLAPILVIFIKPDNPNYSLAIPFDSLNVFLIPFQWLFVKWALCNEILAGWNTLQADHYHSMLEQGQCRTVYVWVKKRVRITWKDLLCVSSNIRSILKVVSRRKNSASRGILNFKKMPQFGLQKVSPSTTFVLVIYLCREREL